MYKFTLCQITCTRTHLHTHTLYCTLIHTRRDNMSLVTQILLSGCDSALPPAFFMWPRKWKVANTGSVWSLTAQFWTCLKYVSNELQFGVASEVKSCHTCFIRWSSFNPSSDPFLLWCLPELCWGGGGRWGTAQGIEKIVWECLIRWSSFNPTSDLFLLWCLPVL